MSGPITAASRARHTEVKAKPLLEMMRAGTWMASRPATGDATIIPNATVST